MRFKAKGKIFSREVEVEWKDGKLTGDPVAVEVFRFWARILETSGTIVEVPMLAVGNSDFEKDPHLTEAILRGSVVSRLEIISSDVHEADDTPKDAVI